MYLPVMANMMVADDLAPNRHNSISDSYYSDVTMSSIASQITDVLIVCSIVC